MCLFLQLLSQKNSYNDFLCLYGTRSKSTTQTVFSPKMVLLLSFFPLRFPVCLGHRHKSSDRPRGAEKHPDPSPRVAAPIIEKERWHLPGNRPSGEATERWRGEDGGHVLWLLKLDQTACLLTPMTQRPTVTFSPCRPSEGGRAAAALIEASVEGNCDVRSAVNEEYRLVRQKRFADSRVGAWSSWTERRHLFKE